MTKIFVKAAPGVEVPLEGAPRRYIAGQAAVLVEDSAYYRRRMADGDLVLCKEHAAAPLAATGEAPAGQTKKSVRG